MQSVTMLKRLRSLTVGLICVLLFVGPAYTANGQDANTPNNTFLQVIVSNGGKVLDLRADGGAVDIESNTNSIFLHSKGTGDCPFRFNNVLINPFGGEGNVGIGTQNPTQKLHVVGNRILLENGGKSIELRADGGAVDLQTTTNHLFISSPQNVVINPESGQGNVGIGTRQPQTKLDVAGTTRTQILEITGGADLAEPFTISDATRIVPGMVVAIDPDTPGQLRLTDQAYDRTVAGIVSGAGGIQPGMIMQQGNEVMTDSYPVALTGRVYVRADATNGSITPGDLLTTANTPGYAMKVTNYTRAQGAILGKAMSELKAGTGLVLMLVTLQ